MCAATLAGLSANSTGSADDSEIAKCAYQMICASGDHGGMAGRELIDDEHAAWYVIDEEIRDRAVASRVCGAVLSVMRPRIARAVIDAFTDFGKTITPEARAAEDELMALSSAQRNGQRRFHRPSEGMNVDLRASNDQEWGLLLIYAAWSINVDLFGGLDEHIGTFHDCAFDVTVKLSSDEAARLAGDLAGTIHLDTYASWRAKKN
jgi:hypothetical protein